MPAVAAQEVGVPSVALGAYRFTELRPQRELPTLRLFGLVGGSLDLASLRGTPVLLNFWATWCAACRTELPALDRLQEQWGRSRLRVLAISQDRGQRTMIDRYIGTLKIRSLSLFWDPNGYVAFADRENLKNAPFALYGMPITYAVTRSGRIVGYVPGAVDWRSDDANRLLSYLHRS